MYPYTYKEDFIIVRRMSNNEMKKVINEGNVTKHVEERVRREAAYIQLGLDTTDFTIGFEVDRLHPNGNELHIVTPTGLTKIYNARTLNLITIIGTRVGQFKRLFKGARVPHAYKNLEKLMLDRQRNNPIHNM